MARSPLRGDPGRQLYLIHQIGSLVRRMENCAPGFGDDDDRTITLCLAAIHICMIELRRLRADVPAPQPEALSDALENVRSWLHGMGPTKKRGPQKKRTRR